MKTVSFALLVASLSTIGTFAKLHNVAVCVSGRTSEIPDWATGPWAACTADKQYETLDGATECACGYYRNRNTGTKQWDRCPDCTYNVDDGGCHSGEWHIGGDEMTHYCTKYCGAQGAEANGGGKSSICP